MSSWEDAMSAAWHRDHNAALRRMAGRMDSLSEYDYIEEPIGNHSHWHSEIEEVSKRGHSFPRRTPTTGGWVEQTVTSKEVAKVTARDAALDQLRTALANFAGVETLLNRFGNQEPPVGSVLRWIKAYAEGEGQLIVNSAQRNGDVLAFDIKPSREYVYVAFRAPDGKWYTTAQRGASRFDWDELVKEIGDSRCELVSEWTEVPAPVKVEESALDPEEWARQMFGKKDEKSARSED